MAIDNFPVWHVSLRHPAGNIPLPEGEPCMYMYNCETFVFFRRYPFVQALFGKTPSTPTREARPDTLVEVRARSEHCRSRGKRSKFFFRWECIRQFPGFLCMRPILYVIAGKFLSVFVALSNEHTAQDIHHRYTTEHAESTTLQRCRP